MKIIAQFWFSIDVPSVTRKRCPNVESRTAGAGSRTVSLCQWGVRWIQSAAELYHVAAGAVKWEALSHNDFCEFLEVGVHREGPGGCSVRLYLQEPRSILTTKSWWDPLVPVTEKRVIIMKQVQRGLHRKAWSLKGKSFPELRLCPTISSSLLVSSNAFLVGQQKAASLMPHLSEQRSKSEDAWDATRYHPSWSPLSHRGLEPEKVAGCRLAEEESLGKPQINRNTKPVLRPEGLTAKNSERGETQWESVAQRNLLKIQQMLLHL